MLLAIPAIALSLAIMAMRNTTTASRHRSYVVYLNRVDWSAPRSACCSPPPRSPGFGALFAGRAMRLGNAQRTNAERHRVVDPADCADPLLRILPFCCCFRWCAGGSKA